MKIINHRGCLIANARDNWKLSEKTESILDAFCFYNPTEISIERYKLFMKEVKKCSMLLC